MLKRIQFFTFLVLSCSLAFGLTDKEQNEADFKALPTYKETADRIQAVLGPHLTEMYMQPISQQFSKKAMTEIVDKFVKAPTLQEKSKVMREELEVEKEIWRRILKTAVANEDMRKEVVEALAGEWVIRSMTAGYREELAKQKKADEDLAKASEDERAARIETAKLKAQNEAAEEQKRRVGRRNVEQSRRIKESKSHIDTDFMALMKDLADKREGKSFGDREALLRPATSVPVKAPQGQGLIGDRDEMRAQILQELRLKREGKVHAEEAPKTDEPVHQDKN